MHMHKLKRDRKHNIKSLHVIVNNANLYENEIRSLAVAKRPCDCSWSVVAKCDWETIFCGHYRPIYLHPP